MISEFKIDPFQIDKKKTAMENNIQFWKYSWVTKLRIKLQNHFIEINFPGHINILLALCEECCYFVKVIAGVTEPAFISALWRKKNEHHWATIFYYLGSKVTRYFEF